MITDGSSLRRCSGRSGSVPLSLLICISFYFESFLRFRSIVISVNLFTVFRIRVPRLRRGCVGFSDLHPFEYSILNRNLCPFPWTRLWALKLPAAREREPRPAERCPVRMKGRKDEKEGFHGPIMEIRASIGTLFTERTTSLAGGSIPINHLQLLRFKTAQAERPPQRLSADPRRSTSREISAKFRKTQS